MELVDKVEIEYNVDLKKVEKTNIPLDEKETKLFLTRAELVSIEKHLYFKLRTRANYNDNGNLILYISYELKKPHQL